MKNLKTSSTSKTPDPGHDAQAAVSSMQPGTVSSIKQEQDTSPTEHEAYLERLGTVKGRLKCLLELTRSEQARAASPP
uniref:Uncharacterized protein n=1 Tax=Arundo donax TaxID=35708 RepID=A0A0A9CL88_ARUDO